MAMLLLQKEKLFDTTIHISPLVIPGVIRVMLQQVIHSFSTFTEAWTYFVCIRPRVCKVALLHQIDILIMLA